MDDHQHHVPEIGKARFPVSVLWLVLLLGLTGAGAVVWGVDHAEADLTSRAEAALAARGLDVGVAFEGRDARLSGTVATETDRAAAVDTVGGLVGVRAVDGSALATGDVVPPLPSDRPGPDVTIVITVDGSSAVVSGRFRDARDGAAVVSAVVAAYGPTRVSDEIRIDPSVAPAPWLPAVVTAVAALGPVGDGVVRVDGTEGVVIEGVVATGELATAVGSAFLAAGLDVDNRLVVGTLETPSVHIHRREPGGDVTVGGIVPGETVVTALMTAAVDTYGVNAVVDETVVGLVDDPPSLARIVELVRMTGALETWSIELDEGVLSVTGAAATEASLDEARASVSAIADDGFAVEDRLELTPAAVGALLTALFAGVEVFAAGEADLTPGAEALVPDAVTIMNGNPSARLVVEGHTDGTGDAGTNLIISQARAEAIVVYLVAGGVAAGRLVAVGYGEERPIADDDTEEGRAMNRRIVFVPREED